MIEIELVMESEDKTSMSQSKPTKYLDEILFTTEVLSVTKSYWSIIAKECWEGTFPSQSN